MATVKPATDTVFVDTITRAGGGTISLSGAYTGDADTDIDIEIVTGDSGSVPRLSTPLFTGAGGSTLTNPSADPGTPAQTLTVTLADLGTETRAAETTVQGVQLIAQTPGPGGNDITISVDATGLVLTDTNFALLDTIDVGVDEYTGPEWDFGAVQLDANGNLPTAAPALVFGKDPQVYRQYKKWESGEWVYVLIPTPIRAVPRNASIKSVSGSVEVTVTDGVTPEVYPSISSLYDFLSALSASSLVQVVGPVTADYTPTGMASVPFSLRTSAYALNIATAGNNYLQGIEFTDLTIDPDAPTETLTIRCEESRIPGSEIWTVTGPISGYTLDNAHTNVQYTDTNAPASFTIPPRSPATNKAPTGRIRIKEIQWAPRTDGNTPDDNVICLKDERLGILAENETFTLEYVPVPSGSCDCELANVEGRPSAFCLGLEETNTVALDPEYLSRLSNITQWRSDFASGNTEYLTEFRTAVQDLNLADEVARIFIQALEDGIWAVPAAFAEWDLAFTAMELDLNNLGTLQGTPADPYWSAGLVVSQTDVGSYYTSRDDFGGGRRYKLVEVFEDENQANYTTNGVAVWSNTIGQRVYDRYSPYPQDPVITSGNVDVSDKPWWFSTNEETQAKKKGYAVLVDEGPLANNDLVYAADSFTSKIYNKSYLQFIRRYEARMDHVRALAGIVPKSAANSRRSACWQEIAEAAYYWQDIDQEYLPFYNNRWQAAVLEQFDPDTERLELTSAQKFGFAIAVTCPGLLIEGDRIVIEVSDVANTTQRYQIGDEFQIPIVAASDLQFGGGQNGNDTHTWTVSSTSGTYPDYAVDLTNPVAYDQNGVSFLISPGAIPDALGDTWTFGVEVGTARWRQDGGGWSTPFDIDSSVALGATGLTANFNSGAAPSWEAGDLHEFDVKQPYSPANLRQPNESLSQWEGTGVVYDVDLGSTETIDAILIGKHSIDSGATIVVGGGATPTADDWQETLTWNAGLIVALISERTAQYLKLTITSSTDNTIGWWFVGLAMSFSRSAGTCNLTREYAMLRGNSGFNPRQFYAGQGRGGELSWSADEEGRFLTQSDIDALLLMIDHIMQQGSEPICLIPHHLHPEEAALVRIDTNRVTLTDLQQWQTNDTSRRILGASLPLTAVIG